MTETPPHRPAGRDERIGPTAHYTAYVWYRLRLPYADLYRTARGARLFWTMRFLVEPPALVSRRIPTVEQYLAQRHLAIDHLLDRHDADRLIEIAAGLSRRSTTWAVDRRVRATEIDLPHMIAAKRALIAERAPAPVRDALAARFEQRALDVLAPEFPATLALLLEGASRPVVVAEGLLGYFERAERGRIVGAVAAALRAVGGGLFLADAHNRARQAPTAAAMAALRASIRLVTRGRGVGDGFADDADAIAFYRAHGFDHAECVRPLDLADAVPAMPRIYTPSSVVRATVGAP